MADCSVEAKEVTGGRVVIDTSKTAGCLSALSGVSCSKGYGGLDTETIAACKGVITGTVAAGGSCYANDNCGSAGQCVFTNGACPGTCKALVPVGGSCSGGNCVIGALCGQGICAALSAAGGPCGDVHHACDDELNCVNNVCVAAKSTGACDDATIHCAFGSVCASGTCKPQVAVGGDCSVDSNVCSFGDYCRAGRCVAFISNGGACDPSVDQCVTGYCDAGTRVCTPRKAGGVACADGLQCQSLQCSAGSNTCTTPTPACVSP